MRYTMGYLCKSFGIYLTKTKGILGKTMGYIMGYIG